MVTATLPPPPVTEPTAAAAPRHQDRLRRTAPLVALLGGTAVLYLWGLGASGYANDFYAAAVQAGTLSWKAMFFGSLDSSNYITVDKPPASLWMMALSGRIFGFSGWSMLVPNALCGVASVGLLYGSVRRVAGPAAGLVAGALLAFTPVAVLMFRFNNPDALLVLLLVFGAYCLTRAVETASWRWITLAGLAIGFGFLTKMLQAFLMLPAFALVYLVAAPTKLRARIGHVLAGGVGVVVGAGWWVLATILWPASSRPYIGGSENNSVLGLAFGYNGLGRIFGGDGNGGGGGRSGGPSQIPAEMLSQLESAGQQAPGFAEGGGPVGGRGGFGGATGLDRLFNGSFASQISWLLPAALILLVGGLWATRRAPRTDRARAALLLWGGWTVVTGLVFSYMEGIVHEYYTVALAPGIAGTVAVGAHALWRTRDEIISRVLLAVAVGATAVWSYILLGRTDWQGWLRVPVLVLGLAGAVVLVLWPFLRTSPIRRSAVVVALATVLFGALAAPTAYALETVTVPHTGAIPLAGPSSAAGPGDGGFRTMIPNGAGPNTANGQEGAPSGREGGPTGEGGLLPGGQGGFPGGQGGQGGMPNVMEGAPNGQEGAPSGQENSPTEQQRGFGDGGGPGGGMGGQVDSAMKELLTNGADGYRWVAAVSSAQSASSLELATGGLPVMAIGGFTGSDQVLTLDEFKQYVADGKIHYYVGGGMGGFPGGGTGDTATGDTGTGDATNGDATNGDAAQAGPVGGFGGPGGGDGDNAKIASWVEENFTSVTVGGQIVYDLTKPVS